MARALVFDLTSAEGRAVSHDYSTEAGTRFAFGANWLRFLEVIDEPRVQRAAEALAVALGPGVLLGSRFLDAGSGSGLSSLAARTLGATVHSFDYDPSSVACTSELRRRFRPADPGWTVERGSVLDKEHLSTLGSFDVVYSWGVLHHTGAMWEALDNVVRLVAPGGKLHISIYNDQGERSHQWRELKRRYVASGAVVQRIIEASVGSYFAVRAAMARLRSSKPDPGSEVVESDGDRRGMSRWHDVRDWVGGYPFEVATPDEVVSFCAERDLLLERMTVTPGGGHGCNEFVFGRQA
jgi:2-polyprenyl-6-hydroxyphenyl methylase/3-demethylubiquinone-9 3-methyltransferase